MKTRLVIGLCASSLLVWGCGKKKDKSEAGGDEMVDVFKDGAMQRVSLKKLNLKAPAERQAQVAPGAARADAIVGWYDSGHNYHAEKMDSKEMGATVINEAAVKGVTLKTGQVYVIRKDKAVAEAVEFSAVSKLNPAALRADAIVGWYDSGHNYHAEKMDSKELGGEVINEAAVKGTVTK